MYPANGSVITAGISRISTGWLVVTKSRDREIGGGKGNSLRRVVSGEIAQW